MAILSTVDSNLCVSQANPKNRAGWLSSPVVYTENLLVGANLGAPPGQFRR